MMSECRFCRSEGWISVNDRTPEKKKLVVVKRKTLRKMYPQRIVPIYQILYFTGKYWVNQDGKRRSFNKKDLWTPLPPLE